MFIFTLLEIIGVTLIIISLTLFAYAIIATKINAWKKRKKERNGNTSNQT